VPGSCCGRASPALAIRMSIRGTGCSGRTSRGRPVDRQEAMIRRIPFQGARNFRDIGGYPAAAGFRAISTRRNRSRSRARRERPHPRQGPHRPIRHRAQRPSPATRWSEPTSQPPPQGRAAQRSGQHDKNRCTVARLAHARMQRHRSHGVRRGNRWPGITVTVRDSKRFAEPLALPRSCPPYVRDQPTRRMRDRKLRLPLPSARTCSRYWPDGISSLVSEI
jgi:hypothetical protein